MGALFRNRLFDHFHEDDVKQKPRNLFRCGMPRLNRKVLERR